MSNSAIYLIPTTLGGETISDIIPEDVKNIAIELRHFIVEDIKAARRYLRKLDRNFPIDESSFTILNKKTEPSELYSLLRPIREGFSIGLMSDAGCPGVADPGAAIVSLAHKEGIIVKPLVGPSSILLTIMGSGFSGQDFAFHGYLPKERRERISALKFYANDARRNGTTHLFMDTPFRNMNVLDDLLNELTDITQLCIGCNLTLPTEQINTRTIKEWRENAYDLSKKPAMFAIGVKQ